MKIIGCNIEFLKVVRGGYLSKFGTILIQQPGSGVLSGKMLLVRIIENNNIDAHFRAG